MLGGLLPFGERRSALFPETKEKTMAVKFLQDHTVGTLYNEGETAGFDRKTEGELIKAKIAEKVEVKKPEPPAA